MAKFEKAIQCKNCGKIMLMSKNHDYCPKCSWSTGRCTTGKDGGRLTLNDWYFGHYWVSYNWNKMKPIMAKVGLFGKLTYVRDLENGE